MIQNEVILQLLNGLVVGSSLALVASGLALLFGVLHIINFAQGDFFMLGGYAVLFLLRLTDNYFLCFFVGTVLVGVAGGLLLSAIVWPLLQRSQVLTLLATLGLSLIIQQLAINILGGDAKLVPPPISTTVRLGPVNYPVYFLLVDASFDLVMETCQRLYAMDRGVLTGMFEPSEFSSPDALAARFLGAVNA